MMGMGGRGAPGGPQMVVLNKNTKRETGRRAQLSNIQAATTVASIVRTTLGEKWKKFRDIFLKKTKVIDNHIAAAASVVSIVRMTSGKRGIDNRIE
jgi:hypothetical protein